MRRERGLAAVTALLIVAIAASTAVLMLSQQSAMLDQSSMVVARAQADTYALAGVDWARGILFEARGKAPYDTLQQPWAQPIAALPVERAVVSGGIEDEQGKFNLNNLAAGTNPGADLQVFRSLLGALDLPPELADAVKDWVDADGDLSGSGGAEDAYYLALSHPYHAANRPMVQIDELYRVRGFDAAKVAKLRPYVTALPIHTAINVNTASDKVLAALTGGVTAADAGRVAAFVAARAEKPFRTVEEARAALAKTVGGGTSADLDVASSFFSVRIQVAQDDVQLASDALLQRRADKTTVILWRRPRY